MKVAPSSLEKRACLLPGSLRDRSTGLISSRADPRSWGLGPGRPRPLGNFCRKKGASLSGSVEAEARAQGMVSEARILFVQSQKFQTVESRQIPILDSALLGSGRRNPSMPFRLLQNMQFCCQSLSIVCSMESGSFRPLCGTALRVPRVGP